MASQAYYPRQAREDYYATGSLHAGEFFGRGTRSLGLEGPPTPEVCGLLARGLGPDGVKKLSQFGGTALHFEGPDICWNPKKWVSAIWASEPEVEQRHRI